MPTMTKILSVWALVALCVFSAYGQRMSAGIRAGVNFSHIRTETDLIGYSFPSGRTGYHVGYFVTAMFSDIFGAQGEMLYSSVGYKVRSTAHKLDYLVVPLLFRYQSSPVLSVHVGPQIGYLISAKLKSEDDSEDISNGHKGFDLGLAVGAEAHLPFALGISARYVAGLLNAFDNDLLGGRVKIYNQVLQLSVTWTLSGELKPDDQ